VQPVKRPLIFALRANLKHFLSNCDQHDDKIQLFAQGFTLNVRGLPLMFCFFSFAEKLEHCVVYRPEFVLKAVITLCRPFMRSAQITYASVSVTTHQIFPLARDWYKISHDWIFPSQNWGIKIRVTVSSSSYPLGKLFASRNRYCLRTTIRAYFVLRQMGVIYLFSISRQESTLLLMKLQWSRTYSGF